MDECQMCHHPWHGLICGQTTRTVLDSNYRIDVTMTEKCKCPGPFGLPTVKD